MIVYSCNSHLIQCWRHIILKFILLLLSIIGILMIGGYVVYPKASYFVYEDRQYYETSTSNHFKADNDHTIIKHIVGFGSDDTILIDVSNDDVSIVISYLDSGIFIEVIKNDLIYNGLLEGNRDNLDAHLIKYVDLAESYVRFESQFNEDFSIVIYIIASLSIIIGVICFNSSLKHYLGGNQFYGLFGLFTSSLLIIMPTIINAILVINRL